MKLESVWSHLVGVTFLAVGLWLGDAAHADNIQRLWNKMLTKHLIHFQTTVEAQAAAFPGEFFLEAPSEDKKIALTFDDGPDPVYTRKVLAILKEHQVKATFFLLGCNLQEYPQVAREIVQQGHAVGGHSFGHPDLRKLTESLAWTQIAHTQAVFKKTLGIYPAFFRPPYGAITNPEIAMFSKRGYRIVDWSIDTFDWDAKQNQPKQILEKFAHYQHPGAIVLMHAAGPGHRHTVEALPKMIRLAQEQGYTLVTIPELLNIPATREGL